MEALIKAAITYSPMWLSRLPTYTHTHTRQHPLCCCMQIFSSELSPSMAAATWNQYSVIMVTNDDYYPDVDIIMTIEHY